MVTALAADAGLDFLTGGKLNKYKRKAAVAVYRSVISPTARVAAPFAGRSALRVAGTIGKIAMQHPYLTAGAIIYVNRDEAADLLREGYEVVTETPIDVSAPLDFIERREQRRTMSLGAGTPTKRKKTKFNRAISAGMKAVKRSRNGGKVGKLTNAKKTFGTVTKTASKILKGRKVSNKGVTGTSARAMRKILKGYK